MHTPRDHGSLLQRGCSWWLLLVVALAGAAALVGCSSSPASSEAAASADGAASLWVSLSGDQGMSGQLLVADLGETTPRATGTTSIVWGSVVSVEPGPVPELSEDGVATESIKAGSDDSMWIHLIVEVRKSIGDGLPSRIRIETPRPPRLSASELSSLPAGDFVGVLVPVESVFEDRTDIAEQYGRLWQEPVYRVFANALFTEAPEKGAASGAGDEDLYLPQPGQIYGPLLYPTDYAMLLKPLTTANNGKPVPTLDQLWGYLESANR